MKMKIQVLVVMLVGAGCSLTAMPFNNRRRNQPPQPAVVAQAPVIVKLQDQAAGIVANGVYEAASNAARYEVRNRVPLRNIEFCPGMSHEHLGQQMVASRVVSLQYFPDVLESYQGPLADFSKVTVGAFRIICTDHPELHTIVIHDIRARTNSTYGDNDTFAAQHGGCRGL